MLHALWGMTTFAGAVGCHPSMPIIKVVALTAHKPDDHFT